MESLASHQHLESADSLAWIASRVSEDTGLSRYRLAKAVCERLGWRDAAGRLKEMACRKRLLALERQGKITLPAARRGPPPGRPEAARVLVWPEVIGALADLGVITLQPIGAGTAESGIWNAMMEAHHPLGRGPLCGRRFAI